MRIQELRKQAEVWTTITLGDKLVVEHDQANKQTEQLQKKPAEPQKSENKVRTTKAKPAEKNNTPMKRLAGGRNTLPNYTAKRLRWEL